MAPSADTGGNLPKPKARRRRWRRRLVVALILTPFVTDFVYTRLTVMPPGLSQPLDERIALSIPPPSVDRTDDLLAAINALPPLPAVGFPPTWAPTGLIWKRAGEAEEDPGFPQGFRILQGGRLSAKAKDPLDARAALVGPWSPETRYYMRRLVRFLDRPIVRDALDSTAALSGEPACLSPLDKALETRLGLTTELLTARARYRLAGQGDLGAAADDALAVLKLAKGVADDQTSRRLSVAANLAATALEEIAHWGQEFALDPLEAREFIRRLEEFTPNIPRMWAVAMRGDCLLHQDIVDRCCTKRASGNGWFVLYDGRGDRPGDWLLHGLNLFSPLFHDRKEVLRTWASYYDSAIAAGVLPPGEAYTILVRASREARRASNLLYPNALALAEPYGAALRWLTAHRAAIACLGLSAYRHDHMRYPESLQMLVPGFLASVPEDPLTGRALGFEMLSDQEFRLFLGEEWEQLRPGWVNLLALPLDLPVKRPTIGEDGRRDARPVVEYILVPDSSPDPESPAPSPGSADY